MSEALSMSDQEAAHFPAKWAVLFGGWGVWIGATGRPASGFDAADHGAGLAIDSAGGFVFFTIKNARTRQSLRGYSPVLVLTEMSEALPPTASRAELRRAAESARMLGLQLFQLPQDLPEGASIADALDLLRPAMEPTPAIWSGYIPEPNRYAETYQALVAKNYFLPNDLEQHLKAQELDRALDQLGTMTPLTIVANSLAEATDAAQNVGFPVFLKGSVQSLKMSGLRSCVAANNDQLIYIAQRLLNNSLRSRGRLLIRQWIPLRHSRVQENGFPLGREYRVFLLMGEVIGLGYYWEGNDPLASLSSEEEREVRLLAMAAAKRLSITYLTVDIGQLTDGSWVVIEVGDGQFAGLSQVPILNLWSQLLKHSMEWLPSR